MTSVQSEVDAWARCAQILAQDAFTWNAGYTKLRRSLIGIVKKIADANMRAPDTVETVHKLFHEYKPGQSDVEAIRDTVLQVVTQWQQSSRQGSMQQAPAAPLYSTPAAGGGRAKEKQAGQEPCITGYTLDISAGAAPLGPSQAGQTRTPLASRAQEHPTSMEQKEMTRNEEGCEESGENEGGRLPAQSPAMKKLVGVKKGTTNMGGDEVFGKDVEGEEAMGRQQATDDMQRPTPRRDSRRKVVKDIPGPAKREMCNFCRKKGLPCLSVRGHTKVYSACITCRYAKHACRYPSQERKDTLAEEDEVTDEEVEEVEAVEAEVHEDQSRKRTRTMIGRPDFLPPSRNAAVSRVTNARSTSNRTVSVTTSSLKKLIASSGCCGSGSRVPGPDLENISTCPNAVEELGYENEPHDAQLWREINALILTNTRLDEQLKELQETTASLRMALKDTTDMVENLTVQLASMRQLTNQPTQGLDYPVVSVSTDKREGGHQHMEHEAGEDEQKEQNAETASATLPAWKPPHVFGLLPARAKDLPPIQIAHEEASSEVSQPLSALTALSSGLSPTPSTPPGRTTSILAAKNNNFLVQKKLRAKLKLRVRFDLPPSPVPVSIDDLPLAQRRSRRPMTARRRPKGSK
ncbi:hypothetical protein NLJ89_g8810 [Agrocybe chaxingu]|uniref:Zn(2)-C6 fungal-type domain-containing protein n=1 Tax=Agrocybe chaxingu TaxID=84603 RepID=A0A9W8K1S4_9AGAR|nr:hypothetical protein NLJ89_g8810 [Agrocybe chaxingu]